MSNKVACLAMGLLVAAVSTAAGQWSADPAANLPVGDRSGEQVQPKIAPTADGGCYLSWLDNAAGGYDVYLQRLSADGVEQWPHNGVLVTDRGVSSTQDYTLLTDADGNAVLTFNDDSSGSSQISIHKLRPDAARVWDLTTSSGTAFKGPPRAAILADGTIGLAWSEDASLRLVRLDGDGQVVSGPLTLVESGHTLSWCDLQPGEDGTLIALWIRTFNTMGNSARWLYAQKFDRELNAVWPVTAPANALIVYAPQPSSPWPTGGGTYGTQGGSVQNGYFPTFLPDGQGGAVFAWYENGGPRHAYLQHVLADGTMKFPVNGLPTVLSAASRIRISAGLAYDPVTTSYFVASVECDASPQQNYTSLVQKIGSNGSRLWGDHGVTVLSGTTYQQSFVQCLTRPGGGCSVFGFDGRNAASSIHVLWAAGVSDEQVIEWSNFPSTTVEAKGRLAVANSTRGFHILAFHGGGTGLANVYAQDVNFNGTLGPIPPVPCDPDYNQDGNADQDDVAYLVNVIAGAPNPTGRDPDFNGDGNADQDDYSALVGVVAGAPCR